MQVFSSDEWTIFAQTKELCSYENHLRISAAKYRPMRPGRKKSCVLRNRVGESLRDPEGNAITQRGIDATIWVIIVDLSGRGTPDVLRPAKHPPTQP